MARKLLIPTLTMHNKLPDNVNINDEKLAAASRIAGWLAHQMNNALGAVSGSSQLLSRRLQRDVSDDNSLQAYLRYLDVIQSETERCAAIVAEIQDFSRPREPRFSSVEVMDAVREAVELARYGREDIEVTIQPAGYHEPLLAKTDRELLVRVLFEVVVNAVQASSGNATSGGVHVMGSFSGADDPGWVSISVKDQGPGMSDEIAQRVFEPFFSTREKAKGLGLTVSMEIMRQLGGAIEIVETGPSGTKVTIDLPSARNAR